MLGVRGALLACGAIVLLALAADTRGLRRTDRTAAGRVRIAEIMRSVPLFAPLRLEGLAAIVARTRRQDVAAGADVIRQDELGERWYVLADGKLEVTIDGHWVQTLLPGDTFGERALLRDDRRSATVSAITDAQVLALDRADFLDAIAGADVELGSEPRTPIEALVRQPLLSRVSRASLDAIAGAAGALELTAGQTIVSEGREDDRWFVVLDGELTVRLDGRPPRRLLPGDSFGEIAVIHRRARTATVVTETGARLMQVPGRQLRRALASAA
jgi:CRP-like cAMP-binding protein